VSRLLPRGAVCANLQIDLALRYGPLPDSGLQARLLVSGHRLVCASPAYWDRHGRPTHPDQLAQHNCLVLARRGAPLSAWTFRENDRTFSVKVSGDRQISDGAILREWSTGGVGVIWNNRQDIRRELEQGPWRACWKLTRRGRSTCSRFMPQVRPIAGPRPSWTSWRSRWLPERRRVPAKA